MKSELRIGNYVFHEGKPLRITNVLDWCVNMEFGEMSGDRNDEIDINEIEHIPLTEELLLKCGFERSKTHDRYFVKDNIFAISTADDKFRFIQGNLVCQLILREIKYVHQLQNLIYSLTEEELQINL